MRIGIEAQRLLRRKKHGMEVVTLELIRHLQQIDHKNEYVVFVKDDEDVDCIQATENFEIIKTPAFHYPYWEQFYLPKLAGKAKIDLLHCTSNTAPVMYQSPMVLTLHDVIYLEKVSFAGTAYQNLGNIYRRWVVPKIVDKCEQILTVSEYEKKRIADYLAIDDNRIKVVYNAINSNFSLIDDTMALQKTAEKYSLPQDYILFFGNTAPKKNTDGVVEAYCTYFHQQENPLPLVITDCKPAYIYGKLKQWANGHEQKLKKSILVLDHIAFDELPYVYNLASLFLYPSFRESFGMPILEAMACGVPVITSNTSSMPEVAGGAAYLIDPAKPLKIAEAISSVQNDRALQAEMMEKGIQRASYFSWKRAAEQVLDTYEQVMLKTTDKQELFFLA